MYGTVAIFIFFPSEVDYKKKSSTSGYTMLLKRAAQCESDISDRFSKSDGLPDDKTSWPEWRRAGTQLQ